MLVEVVAAVENEVAAPSVDHGSGHKKRLPELMEFATSVCPTVVVSSQP